MPSYLFESPLDTNPHIDLILYKRKTAYQLILRNREDGSTVNGQWLLHVKIFPEMCSYDGKYFVYHYSVLRTHETFTVLSSPPYFTAHIIWSGIGTWFGGGNLSDGQLTISEGSHSRWIRGELPNDLTIHPVQSLNLSKTFTVMNETSMFSDNKFEQVKPPENY